MAILIDAKFVGSAMRHARSSLYWNEAEIAKLLGTTEQQFQLCERGLGMLTQDQFQQIFTMGFMMMRARQLQHEYCRMSARIHNPKHHPVDCKN